MTKSLPSIGRSPRCSVDTDRQRKTITYSCDSVQVGWRFENRWDCGFHSPSVACDLTYTVTKDRRLGGMTNDKWRMADGK